MSTKTFALEYTMQSAENQSVGVIIVAAGTASRMQGTNKILANIAGQPVIKRTISAFDKNPKIKNIVVVTRKDMIADIQNILQSSEFSKVTNIIEGGKCREESVKIGLETLKAEKGIKSVLIHDGARPFVNTEVINRVITATEEFSSAIPAVPVKDTIKEVGKIGKVEKTVDREKLVNIQTPQGFKLEVLDLAFEKAGEKLDKFTDDSALVENAGLDVYTVMGDYSNIKITTPEDLVFALALVSFKEGEK